MNSRIVSIFCACVLFFGTVTSTPVLPSFPLKKFSPVDICLFMCNICFDDMGAEMMTCANDVCLAKQGNEMNMGLLKLGRTCRNYNKLDAFIFGNETD